MDREPPAWAIRTKADSRAIEEGCFFDHALANQATDTIERCYRSQYIKGGIKLRDEQKQFLQSIYGWRLPDGRRRFRFVTLHVPKKSFGKSLMLTCVAFLELLFSGEPSPVILCGAATRENAGALYQEVKYALNQTGLTDQFIKYRDASKKLHIPGEMNATLECVSKWGKSTHGPNCSLVLLDECHVMEQSLYQALRYAGRTRPNYMCLLASTAGDDTTHWYYSIYQKAKRVISGEDLDITHFAFVCEADQDGDYYGDPNQWVRANPNLGTPECPLDTFKAELQAAKSTGVAEWLNFLKLNLNVWVKPSEFAWLDVTPWNRFREEVPDEVLRGCRCGLGCDGSQTTDPTSVSMAWQLPDGRLYVRSWAWVAREGVVQREATNLPLYDQFPEITVTDGNMIDYRLVREHVIALCQKYRPALACFDPTMVPIMMSEIMDEGQECRRVPQNFRHFDPAMRAFQLAWDEGRVRHDGGDWLRYCFQNVRLEMNKYGEMRPHRGRSPDKIDGAVSTLLAVWGLLEGDKPATTLGGFA